MHGRRRQHDDDRGPGAQHHVDITDDDHGPSHDDIARVDDDQFDNDHNHGSDRCTRVAVDAGG